MSEKTIGIIIGFVWGLFVAFSFVVFILKSKPEYYWHDEAVAHQAAYYFLDEHNNKQWRWVK